MDYDAVPAKCTLESCKNERENLKLILKQTKRQTNEMQNYSKIQSENEILRMKLVATEDTLRQSANRATEALNAKEIAEADLKQNQSSAEFYRKKCLHLEELADESEKHKASAIQWREKYDTICALTEKLEANNIDIKSKYEATVKTLELVGKKTLSLQNQVANLKTEKADNAKKSTKLDKYLSSAIQVIDALSEKTAITRQPKNIQKLIELFRQDDVRLFFNSDRFQSSEASTSGAAEEEEDEEDEEVDLGGHRLSDDDEDDPEVRDLEKMLEKEVAEQPQRTDLMPKMQELKKKKEAPKMLRSSEVRRYPRGIRKPVVVDNGGILNPRKVHSRQFPTTDFDSIAIATEARKKTLLTSSQGAGTSSGATIHGRKGKTVREQQQEMMKESVKEKAARLRAEQMVPPMKTPATRTRHQSFMMSEKDSDESDNEIPGRRGRTRKRSKSVFSTSEDITPMPPTPTRRSSRLSEKVAQNSVVEKRPRGRPRTRTTSTASNHDKDHPESSEAISESKSRERSGSRTPRRSLSVSSTASAREERLRARSVAREEPESRIPRSLSVSSTASTREERLRARSIARGDEEEPTTSTRADERKEEKKEEKEKKEEIKKAIKRAAPAPITTGPPLRTRGMGRMRAPVVNKRNSEVVKAPRAPAGSDTVKEAEEAPEEALDKEMAPEEVREEEMAPEDVPAPEEESMAPAAPDTIPELSQEGVLDDTMEYEEPPILEDIPRDHLEEEAILPISPVKQDIPTEKLRKEDSEDVPRSSEVAQPFLPVKLDIPTEKSSKMDSDDVQTPPEAPNPPPLLKKDISSRKEDSEDVPRASEVADPSLPVKQDIPMDNAKKMDSEEVSGPSEVASPPPPAKKDIPTEKSSKMDSEDVPKSSEALNPPPPAKKEVSLKKVDSEGTSELSNPPPPPPPAKKDISTDKSTRMDSEDVPRPSEVPPPISMALKSPKQILVSKYGLDVSDSEEEEALEIDVAPDSKPTTSKAGPQVPTSSEAAPQNSEAQEPPKPLPQIPTSRISSEKPPPLVSSKSSSTSTSSDAPSRPEFWNAHDDRIDKIISDSIPKKSFIKQPTLPPSTSESKMPPLKKDDFLDDILSGAKQTTPKPVKTLKRPAPSTTEENPPKRQAVKKAPEVIDPIPLKRGRPAVKKPVEAKSEEATSAEPSEAAKPSKTILIEAPTRAHGKKVKVEKKPMGIKEAVAKNLEKGGRKVNKHKTHFRQALDLKVAVSELHRPMQEKGVLLGDSIPLSPSDAVDVMMEYLRESAASDMWAVLNRQRIDGNLTPLMNTEEENFLQVSVSLNEDHPKLLDIFINRILHEISLRDTIDSKQCGRLVRLFCHAIRFAEYVPENSEGNSEEQIPDESILIARKSRWMRFLFQILFYKHPSQLVRSLAYCLISDVAEHCRFIVDELEKDPKSSEIHYALRILIQKESDQAAVVNWLLNSKFQAAYVNSLSSEEIKTVCHVAHREFVQNSKDLKKSVFLAKCACPDVLEVAFELLEKNMILVDRQFLEPKEKEKELRHKTAFSVPTVATRMTSSDALAFKREVEWQKTVLLVMIDNPTSTHYNQIMKALTKISVQVVAFREIVESSDVESFVDPSGVESLREAVQHLLDLICEFTNFPLKPTTLSVA